MKNIIGKRIRDIRKSMNLSGEEFGNKLNVSKTAVSNWENGNRVPDADALNRIADLGDVSIDWIFGRTDVPNAKLYKYVFDGEEVEIAIDKNKSPDEQLVKDLYEKIKLVKQLENMGFKFPEEKKE